MWHALQFLFASKTRHFQTYLAKKKKKKKKKIHENHMFQRCFAYIFPELYTQYDHFSIFEGVLILWRRSVVIH